MPPDADGFVNVMVSPWHTGPAFTIAPALGDTLTVTVIVVNADPHDALISVKVIVVVPPLTPVTTPVIASTDPIVVLLLLHTPDPPDAVASLKVMVKPVQTVFAPVIVPAITEAIILTVVVVAVVVPQVLVADNVYTPAFAATTPLTDALTVNGEVIAVPPGPLHE